MAEHAFSVEEAGNLVVVKTRSGSASMLGEVVDNADVPGLVGTIAGDNTIMIAAKTEERAREIAQHMANMLR